MKKTVDLYDLITSELNKRGYSDFYDYEKGQVRFTKGGYMDFINKGKEIILEIANDIFFSDLSLNNKELDKRLKLMFCQKFIDRPIAFQTREIFQSHVTFIFSKYFDSLNFLGNNLENYMTGGADTETKGNQDQENNYRQLYSDLPQDNPNFDLASDNLDYASNNTISKSLNKGNNNQRTTSKKYDIQTLNEYNKLLNSMYYELGKKCFMKIW